MLVHHRDTEDTETTRSLLHDDRQFLHKELTEKIIGAAIEVHRALGPGLLESAYEVCLADELTRSQVRFARQIELPIEYKGRHMDAGYRLDFLIEDEVIVELKCVERIIPIHEAQLLTYLRLAQKRVGLLINFNVPRLRDGIVRRIL
ncbi:MAG: GxxExxY protein [Planctomycetes bacterium]|nr:GxxExxY protein [Planctomycetota bacterium]